MSVFPLPVKAILLALVLSLSAGACAHNSRFGPQTTSVNYYPQCYEPIAQMRSNEFMVEESTAAGAIAGALLGALAGYAVDGGRGALIGATMGAVTGGIVANQFAQAAQERDDSRRLGLYAAQLEEASSNMNATTAAAAWARQCYEKQFETAVQEYRAGYIDKEQFRSRYTEVAAGMEEASRVLDTTIASIDEVSAMYASALNEESNRLQVDKTTMQELHQASLQEIRQPDKPASRRPSTGLNQENDRSLNVMVRNGAAVENSVDNAKAERDLINARLDLANQVAVDILS
jgi:outer membrane lipoprotein SlyB